MARNLVNTRRYKQRGGEEGNTRFFPLFFLPSFLPLSPACFFFRTFLVSVSAFKLNASLFFFVFVTRDKSLIQGISLSYNNYYSMFWRINYGSVKILPIFETLYPRHNFSLILASNSTVNSFISSTIKFKGCKRI